MVRAAHGKILTVTGWVLGLGPPGDAGSWVLGLLRRLGLGSWGQGPRPMLGVNAKGKQYYAARQPRGESQPGAAGAATVGSRE